MATHSKPRRGVGRPSVFKAEFIAQAEKLTALGATDREVAEFFGVAERTLYRWQHEHPEFSRALKLGKDASDARVEKSLYRRAVGYSFDSVKILQYQGKGVVVPYEEHVPPDTTACMFWLRNRRRDEWCDKINHEHSGKDGGPIETNEVGAIEAARRIAFILGQGLRAAEQGEPA